MLHFGCLVWDISGPLKSGDARSVKATLQMIYHGDWEMIVMCPGVAGSECYEDEHPLDHLRKFYHGKVISVNREWHDGENIPKRDLAVRWATELQPADVPRRSAPYVAYGNEASLSFIYSAMCLVVEVGPAGSRATLG
ncbi:uncharacterized protein PHACADRAFT_202751 [Phanerochaete carnosa HHB-10118-sp]|uniref:Uncharacterized protein n=1 Tax=Phanerochaete carnosa (strain HHB-10118-sp) TaxID=650164 RepID=K5UG87_PHACS|nr:uncharacterized protein PHACADRAFT_202751 [Phanerochaete carnosa HHB-10118-sp]EKM48486.1 hypothetical protein PHACADRAFT_202751 [Phanerochaete carnosa HHB-10118-sp]